jgi:phenylpropionate dioxygenase-like ring-hydroxylating dioxygenase large terminal subunit
VLTREENDLLTQTGPGTPGGELMRRYWQPAALSEELPPDGPPRAIRLFSEDLVLFRDEEGRPGLLGIHCSHRRADLSYGRIEDGGLRCPYHGWLYDVGGRCLQQPGEPKGSTFKNTIRHLAYPCVEAGGVVFTYMGPGEPPLLPNYSFLTVPPDFRSNTKSIQECNWLQGLEGEIDPVHISFLHRFFKDRGAQDRAVPGGSRSINSLVGDDLAPRLEVEEADFGVRLYAIRETSDGDYYLRMNNFVYPNIGIFSAGRPKGDGYGVNWHVPIDDTNHWKYSWTHSRTSPLDPSEARGYATNSDLNPDYTLKRNKRNRYLQDREEMKTTSFLGMGLNFNVHDAYATEGQGEILDRTLEHLGYSDKPIAMMRKVLLRAIRELQEGKEPPHVIRAEADNHFPYLGGYTGLLGPTGEWQGVWKELAVYSS